MGDICRDVCTGVAMGGKGGVEEGGVPRRKIICLQNIGEIEKVKEMREEGYVNNIFIKKQMIRIP